MALAGFSYQSFVSKIIEIFCNYECLHMSKIQQIEFIKQSFKSFGLPINRKKHAGSNPFKLPALWKFMLCTVWGISCTQCTF